MAGPAAAIASLPGHGWDRNSSRLPGMVPSWPGLSPAIWTKPPSGIHARRYSVPPRVSLIRAGPKPRENLRTLTPRHFATRKWPSSWTKITRPSRTAPGIRSFGRTGNSLDGKLFGEATPAFGRGQAGRDADATYPLPPRAPLEGGAPGA